MFKFLKIIFSDLKSEYLKIKYFETSNLFFKPKTVVVGHVRQKKFFFGVDNLLMVPVQAHYLSIKKNL